ncbi:PREDICTED: uncharacterized protein LOC104789345 [Camelina sativa]|uniref:Uncharacterized protein LOC104789345 n=1 Tax=Camelina sativa TaxID=90675 RepID=A0ABM0ZBP3_CAMSA|nr:PREDICTED: uncharacterized protein LOC104789345 [Camelina sativa]
MAVSKTNRPDCLVWHFTKSGKYSVKTGYRVARELIAEIEYGPTCTALRAQSWELDVPPKIQHFFWQIASGTLPVLERLAHRGIRCDTRCKRCDLTAETINHALFECPRSRQIWELTPVSLDPQRFPYASIYANLDFIFWRASSQSGVTDIALQLPWIIWSLWKDRNKKVFQGIEAEPNDILGQAANDRALWEEAKAFSRGHMAPTPPLEDRIFSSCCQIDGSWKGSDPFQGLGWWYCNDEGSTLLLGARSFRRGSTPLHAELQALIWAMEALLEAGVDCQAYETDCAELVEMVQTPDDWPAFANLMKDFSLLRSSFPSFILSKISRESNARADCLARFSRSLPSETSFVNSYPPLWATNRGVLF